MGCPPVGCDNPRALASELYYVQVDKHGTAIHCTISLAISYVSHLYVLIFVQYRTISTMQIIRVLCGFVDDYETCIVVSNIVMGNHFDTMYVTLQKYNMSGSTTHPHKQPVRRI